jgi:hypothetical protein
MHILGLVMTADSAGAWRRRLSDAVAEKGIAPDVFSST